MANQHLPETFKESQENIETYARDQIQLLKLELVDKVATLSASFVKAVVFVTLAGSFFLLLNLGLSLYLNDVMESNYWGFFIVAGIYLGMGLLFFLLRTPLLTTPIQDKIVAELMADEDEQTATTPQATTDGTTQN